MVSLATIDWGTVFISVIGSILVSTYSIHRELKLQRNYQRTRELEQWYHKVISLNLRVRKLCLRLPYELTIDPDTMQSPTTENEELERLDATMGELLALHTQAPPETDQHLLEQLEEIGFWWGGPNDSSEFSTTHLRNFLIKNSESLIDSIVEASERYEEPPY